MEAFISGGWRNIQRSEVLVAGSWRRVTRVEVYKSGAWRSAVKFTGPLSVSANEATGSASGGSRTVTVTSSASQAAPSGGLGLYTYSWTILSGSASVQTPSNASTTFSQSVSPNSIASSVARVTCTDALGSSAFYDITVTLFNESDM